MTEESTATEQPAPSIAESLESAFTLLENNDESTDAVQGEEETGRGTEEVAEPETLAAPEHWPEADRELFNGTPKEAQEFMLRRHKEMEGDYTRKSQEVAEIRKDLGDFYTEFTPHKARLPQGVSAGDYLRNLVNADLLLSQNPQEGLQRVAKMYGINLGGEQEQEGTDPQVQALKEELGGLRGQIEQQHAAEAQDRHNKMVQKIQTFGEEKTEAGELAHPFLEDVVSDMATLAAAARMQGQEPELKELYERAVWANPQVREKHLTSQRQAEDKKAKDEARAKAAAAKKAGRSLEGTSVSESTPPAGLRETLERALG